MSHWGGIVVAKKIKNETRVNIRLEANCLRSLSERDAMIIVSVLDGKLRPNAALRKAAAWYKENFGHA
jgi:hypothetical protein